MPVKQCKTKMHSDTEVKNYFLMFKHNFLYFSLHFKKSVPIASHPFTGDHWEGLTSLFTPPLRYLHKWIRSPWAFSGPGWTNSPGSLSPPLHQRCSSPLLLWVALRWTHCGTSLSVLYWGAENWTQVDRGSQRPTCSFGFPTKGLNRHLIVEPDI